jgi:hypothetical protein
MELRLERRGTSPSSGAPSLTAVAAPIAEKAKFRDCWKGAVARFPASVSLFAAMAPSGDPSPGGRRRECYGPAGSGIQRPMGKSLTLGHTKGISIYELAVRVKAMTQSPSEIAFVPYEPAL